MDNRPTIAEVQEWVLKLYNTCEQTITSEERKEQHKYAVMVQRPQDKKFLVKMLDRPDILKIVSRKAGAMLNRPVRVQLVDLTAKPAGNPRMEQLMNFGREHSDIVKINK